MVRPHNLGQLQVVKLHLIFWLRKHDPFIKFVFFRLGDLKDVFYSNKIQFL